VNVTTELQEFILEEIAPGRAIAAIGPDEDLLARGLVDSLGVTQLIEFLRDRYGVAVGPDDLVPANFTSLRAIAALVVRKRATPC
jgi:acyl carrier protein